MAQRDLKKGGFYFCYDCTPDWEKESPIDKSEEKSTTIEFKMCVVVDNGSCVIVTHQIFFFFPWKTIVFIEKIKAIWLVPSFMYYIRRNY